MVVLADIFGDNMVLQRERQIYLFGELTEEANLQVEIDGRTVAQEIVAAGPFRLSVPPQKTAFDRTLSIKENGRISIELHHVQFGEVWLAGGQSNMEFPMFRDSSFTEEIPYADNKSIFYYEVPKLYSEHQIVGSDVKAQGCWRRCTSKTIRDFSAVAYYFAKTLSEKLLGVPIGIVSCNYGGSYIMSWLPDEVLSSNDVFAYHYNAFKTHCASLDMKQYEKKYLSAQKMVQSKFYKSLVLQWYFRGIPRWIVDLMWKSRGGKPVENEIFGPWDEWRPAGLYDFMLQKIIGFTVRGVIWYQGEAEAESKRIDRYYDSMRILIETWRSDWECDLPFILTELAYFGRDIFQTGENYPKIRRQQRQLAQTMDNVYTVSAEDCGAEDNIHPPFKKKVGQRLAGKALETIYAKGEFAQ